MTADGETLLRLTLPDVQKAVAVGHVAFTKALHARTDSVRIPIEALRILVLVAGDRVSQERARRAPMAGVPEIPQSAPEPGGPDDGG